MSVIKITLLLVIYSCIWPQLVISLYMLSTTHLIAECFLILYLFVLNLLFFYYSVDKNVPLILMLITSREKLSISSKYTEGPVY
jgi:hypothetical protein